MPERESPLTRLPQAGETLRWPLREIHADWFGAIANALHQNLTTT